MEISFNGLLLIIPYFINYFLVMIGDIQLQMRSEVKFDLICTLYLRDERDFCEVCEFWESVLEPAWESALESVRDAALWEEPAWD